MFVHRNKHIMIDLGTGNNNKVNWCIHDKQEMIDIIETVHTLMHPEHTHTHARAHTHTYIHTHTGIQRSKERPRFGCVT
jgi:hypothetical protein